MPGIEFKVTVQGVTRLRRIVERLSQRMRTRTDLHARWAVLASAWVDRNFQTEGGLVGGWPRLSPNTIAARRKGSGRILQDTGQLRASFIPSWDAYSARVGTPVVYASYHEKGTAPYTIRPRNPDGFLRFVVATEYGIRTRFFKRGPQQIPYAKGITVYAKEVHHPGLPVRRMLPKANDPVLMPQVLKAALEYLRVRESGGE